jgi:hypothetical protein
MKGQKNTGCDESGSHCCALEKNDGEQDQCTRYMKFHKSKKILAKQTEGKNHYQAVRLQPLFGSARLWKIQMAAALKNKVPNYFRIQSNLGQMMQKYGFFKTASLIFGQ